MVRLLVCARSVFINDDQLVNFLFAINHQPQAHQTQLSNNNGIRHVSVTITNCSSLAWVRFERRVSEGGHTHIHTYKSSCEYTEMIWQLTAA